MAKPYNREITMSASAMPSEFSSILPPEAYAQIGVIGQGAMGQSALHYMINEIENRITVDPGDIQPVAFTIYDMTCDDGPYELTNPLFRLNFPVQCEADRVNLPAGFKPEGGKTAGMHLMEEDENSLIEWLEMKRKTVNPAQASFAAQLAGEYEKDGLPETVFSYNHPEQYIHYMLTREDGEEWGGHSYLPRAIYNEYLKHCMAQTVEKVRLLNERIGYEVIKLQPPIHGIVTEITQDRRKSDNSLILKAKEAIACAKKGATTFNKAVKRTLLDAAIIGTGHKHTALFGKAARHAVNFVDTPFGDREIEHGLTNHLGEDETVVIAGCGASYYDALRNLEALQYKGKIVAIAPSGAPKFWPFDARKNGQPYDLTTLRARLEVCTNLEETKAALEAEIHSGAGLAGGAQNIFAALSAQRQTIDLPLSEADCAQFYRHAFTVLEVQRTSPEAYDTEKRLKDSGQLIYRSARIGVPVKRRGVVTEVPLRSPDGKQMLDPIRKPTLFIDTASLATSPVNGRGNVHCEIKAKLCKAGLAEIDSDSRTVVPTDRRVGLIGAGAWTGRGIPYIRHELDDNVRPAFEQALTLAAERRKKLGITLPAPRHG